MLYTGDMENAQQIDPQALQNLLGNSSVSPANLIPESLVSILTTALLVSLGLMVVFLILYGFSVARKRKVQSAVLHMQKDIAEIKLALMAPSTPSPATLPFKQEPRDIKVTSDK